jgi:hypothetical protein
MATRVCKDCLSVAEDPCIVYTGVSVPEVGLVNGQTYSLSYIIQQFLFYVATHTSPGTTTTTSSTTSTSTTVGDFTFLTEI